MIPVSIKLFVTFLIFGLGSVGFTTSFPTYWYEYLANWISAISGLGVLTTALIIIWSV